MDESTERLEAAYRTAYAAAIKTGNRVLNLSEKVRLGTAELNEALAENRVAEEALIKARAAYHAASNPGIPFSSL
jgi:hypothetical protein